MALGREPGKLRGSLRNPATGQVHGPAQVGAASPGERRRLGGGPVGRLASAWQTGRDRASGGFAEIGTDAPGCSGLKMPGARQRQRLRLSRFSGQTGPFQDFQAGTRSCASFRPFSSPLDHRVQPVVLIPRAGVRAKLPRHHPRPSPRRERCPTHRRQSNRQKQCQRPHARDLTARRQLRLGRTSCRNLCGHELQDPLRVAQNVVVSVGLDTTANFDVTAKSSGKSHRDRSSAAGRFRARRSRRSSRSKTRDGAAAQRPRLR